MSTDLPVACELTPAAMRARRADLIPRLVERANDLEKTANGYRLTFDPSTEMLRAIVDTIDAERQCCRWLHFELSIAADGGPITLTLAGPDGAQDFLAALFEGR